MTRRNSPVARSLRAEFRSNPQNASLGSSTRQRKFESNRRSTLLVWKPRFCSQSLQTRVLCEWMWRLSKRRPVSAFSASIMSKSFRKTSTFEASPQGKVASDQRYAFPKWPSPSVHSSRGRNSTRTPRANASDTSRSGRQRESPTILRPASMLISAKERNSSEIAREAAKIPTREQYSRSGRRVSAMDGPTLAIQPSNVTRKEPSLGCISPKMTALLSGPRLDLPHCSLSERVRAGATPDGVEKVDADIWFADWERGGALLEEARHFPQWDQTLTLLSFENDEVPPAKKEETP